MDLLGYVPFCPTVLEGTPGLGIRTLPSLSPPLTPQYMARGRHSVESQ